MSARELLRHARTYGRMTGEDAVQLAAVFVQVGGRHARDTAAGLERRVGGLAGSARRAARLPKRSR